MKEERCICGGTLINGECPFDDMQSSGHVKPTTGAKDDYYKKLYSDAKKIVESTKISYLPDSGKRREFTTGSVRDDRTGKGRFDLLSPIVAKRDAIHMEKGAVKYAERNWEKGQNLMSYLDSAQRHLEDYKACLLLEKEPEEDHLSAIRWNIGSFIHTEEMIKRGLLPSDLDDRPRPLPKLEGRPYNDPRCVKMGVLADELSDKWAARIDAIFEEGENSNE